MRLKDRVVIVTGAAQGIGQAYARRVAAEGARVVVADVDGAGARVAAGELGDEGHALGIQVDVSDEASVGQMVQATIDAFGRVDGLVNNAALFAPLEHQPVEEIAVDLWDRVFAVNVRGVFLCCKAVIPQMRRQGKGKIVNIASGTLLSGGANFSHYVASKGAVFAFTRSICREVGKDGIAVNTLAPGLVPTPGARIHHTDEMFAGQHRIRAFARDEQPEDLVGAMVFLLSDDSDFMTGQMMVVNGGAQFW